MEQRISIKDLEPKAYPSMYELNRYLSSASLDTRLKDLIKIRASQINGCAYCIETHSADALKHGEDHNRIFALSAWWESPRFTNKEKAALAMTDEITLIADNGLTEATYQEASRYFNENELAQIIMQIGAINIWNRIAVSTHMFHPKQVAASTTIRLSENFEAPGK